MANKDISERSCANRSGVSRRSKYSQSNLLQKSSIFAKNQANVEETKLNEKQEELEALKTTVAACHRKI